MPLWQPSNLKQQKAREATDDFFKKWYRRELTPLE